MDEGGSTRCINPEGLAVHAGINNENSQAGHVTGNHPSMLAALREIPQRAVSITGSTEVGAAVLEVLEESKAYWLKTASVYAGTQLGYKTRRDGKTIGLLHQPGLGDWTPFTCLNSLRDVECTSDPLCAEHTCAQDRSLHEAACHACLFLSFVV